MIDKKEFVFSVWSDRLHRQQIIGGIIAVFFVVFLLFLGLHGVVLIDGFHLAGG